MGIHAEQNGSCTLVLEGFCTLNKPQIFVFDGCLLVNPKP